MPVSVEDLIKKCLIAVQVDTVLDTSPASLATVEALKLAAVIAGGCDRLLIEVRLKALVSALAVVVLPGGIPPADLLPSATAAAEHLERCPKCRNAPFGMCPQGGALLSTAGAAAEVWVSRGIGMARGKRDPHAS